METPLTFEAWMKIVDDIMVDLYGTDSGSVEDWPWFDAFSDGLDPSEATLNWFNETWLVYT